MKLAVWLARARTPQACRAPTSASPRTWRSLRARSASCTRTPSSPCWTWCSSRARWRGPWGARCARCGHAGARCACWGCGVHVGGTAAARAGCKQRWRQEERPHAVVASVAGPGAGPLACKARAAAVLAARLERPSPPADLPHPPLPRWPPAQLQGPVCAIRLLPAGRGAAAAHLPAAGADDGAGDGALWRVAVCAPGAVLAWHSMRMGVGAVPAGQPVWRSPAGMLTYQQPQLRFIWAAKPEATQCKGNG